MFAPPAGHAIAADQLGPLSHTSMHGDVALALAGPGGAGAASLLLAFDTGQREYLPWGVTAVLGRRPTPTVPGESVITVLQDGGTVSKNHLRVEHADDGVWVTDLGSTNGSVLVAEDGTRTAAVPGARLALDDGVRVRIGDRSWTATLIQGRTEMARRLAVPRVPSGTITLQPRPSCR
ncbi:FHA domain-containing protein [Xylanimonas allomyrinae]|uniref:FHA domain-containing protein n=1 Tax=Xylanimonas allomyrinae TaxID=2509459 RepID=UPI001FE4CBA2|nr:FHA domain-containing protein [Xylanimonas allomyrinae]